MAKRIIIIGFIAAGIALAYLKRAEIKQLLFGTQKTINRSEVTLLIKEDMTADALAGFLVEKGVLNETKPFLKQLEKQELSGETFDAGKYVILSGTKLTDLAHGFSRGENGHGVAELKVKVLFNRCTTIEDIGMNISKCISADSSSLVDYISAPSTLSKYSFTLQQMPALFLPDEYEMYYDTDAAEFVAAMADEFKQFWTEERKSKLKAIGLAYPSQATTLASIVYAEQGKIAAEWPVIARLYLNRLKKGMKLQSDPTFKFCWGSELNGVQRLVGKHRNIDCDYNTYKINGLPPGPICIVPKKVIDAVLSPAENNYLFMCAKPDYSGEHDFTHSDIVHVKNALAYHRWLNKEGKK
ncbi:endolytic transglycosylase MltG [Crocinitomicaceae bacterium CZZ-1]|uniref:Endolytic murein transglycosylase n=1 Tax=Taishania pollutisoli TaxID=2766479 RepID=A0A8J6PBL5_9FLAO|nr:endolytic transglycosylase MltG [Taishania pollutisoli]MBC9811862.1 endolytic transglycosylase MltG [Taishania pollutisoli]